MSKPISKSIGWTTSITISASSMVALVISILLSILFYVHSMTRQCWCWLHCLTGGHCHMSVWMMGMLRKAATSDAKQVWDFDRHINISLLKNHSNLYSWGFLLLPFFPNVNANVSSFNVGSVISDAIIQDCVDHTIRTIVEEQVSNIVYFYQSNSFLLPSYPMSSFLLAPKFLFLSGQSLPASGLKSNLSLSKLGIYIWY